MGAQQKMQAHLFPSARLRPVTPGSTRLRRPPPGVGRGAIWGEILGWLENSPSVHLCILLFQLKQHYSPSQLAVRLFLSTCLRCFGCVLCVYFPWLYSHYSYILLPIRSVILSVIVRILWQCYEPAVKGQPARIRTNDL